MDITRFPLAFITLRSGRACGGLLLATSLALSCGRPVHAASAAAGADEGGFITTWLANSDASKEAQPHWMTPLVTVTPRLEQEFRYDQTWQDRPKDVTVDNYGNGKGLELIPTFNSEVIIGVPAHLERTNGAGERTSGWADESLLLKYRFATANEEHGNYIFTGFLGVSLPTGSDAFTNNETIISPTLAGGYGWGSRQAGFDIQSTLGIAIPTANLHKLGEPVTWNVAFQAYSGKLWPEIEGTYTYYKEGPNDGKSQFAYTVGLVAGRFHLGRRARLIIGGGYQECVSSYKSFNHTWLLTGRVAF